MKIQTVLFAAALALAGVTSASAQHPPEGRDHDRGHDRGHSRGAVTYSHEHGAMLREHATTHRHRSADHHDFQVHVGAILPHSVDLHTLPDGFRAHSPHSYRYGIVNRRHVVVDPGSRRIVHVFE